MTKPYTVLLNAAFKYCDISMDEKNTIIDLYNDQGQDSIYEFAKNKKVLPFVSRVLSMLDLDKDFWDKVAHNYKMRNENIIKVLDVIFTKFHQNGVKKIFVTENFGALLAADVDKALFASGDVDLYADISQREQIYSSFEQLGYIKQESYSHRKLISTSFHNKDVFPEGFHFVVAWNPLSRTKLPCFVEADEFVLWDKIWKYKNTAINLPNVDALMYICLLHISLHSFSRAPDIRLYIDINNVSKLPVNWENVIAIAKRDKTMVRLLTASILAKKLLSVNIPDFVLNYQSQYNRSITNLLKIVFDRKNNCLICEPTGLKVFLIEALADDDSLLCGVINILFPNRYWVKDVYVGKKGNIFMGYLKHVVNLI